MSAFFLTRLIEQSLQTETLNKALLMQELFLEFFLELKSELTFRAQEKDRTHYDFGNAAHNLVTTCEH